MAEEMEKRRFARTEINAAVRYRVAEETALRDGCLGNISAGGILLWANRAWPVGTVLYLRLRSEELGDDEVEITARVVRHEAKSPQPDQFGHGCRFDAIYSGPFGNADEATGG